MLTGLEHDSLAESRTGVVVPGIRSLARGLVSAGYEGRTIEGFVSLLTVLNVGTVVDVRLNAISRKPGFSKRRLREALAGAGVGYVHLRSLGNVKENREPFRTGRVAEGRRVFGEALRAPEAQASLAELAVLASKQVVAVLCFEADAAVCHRQVVIDHIVQTRRLPVAALPDR